MTREGWGAKDEKGGLWMLPEEEKRKASWSPQLLGTLRRGLQTGGVMRTLWNPGSKRCNLFIFVFGFHWGQNILHCVLCQFSDPLQNLLTPWLDWLHDYGLYIFPTLLPPKSILRIVATSRGRCWFRSMTHGLVSLSLSPYTVWRWREHCSYSWPPAWSPSSDPSGLSPSFLPHWPLVLTSHCLTLTTADTCP